MLDTKVTRDEVAERLGISVRDVKRSKAKPSAATESGAVDETPAHAGDESQGDAHDSYAA
jgi:hypothetical protein